MPRYKCKAKDMEGNVYKGVMEAADERVLLKVLRDKGLYCFECRGLDSGMALRPAKIKHKLLPPLCRQLSAMLAAGVPLQIGRCARFKPIAAKFSILKSIEQTKRIVHAD